MADSEVETLIAQLTDIDHEVRRFAAKKLKELKDANAAFALSIALADKDIFVRNYATDALILIGEQSLKYVSEQLKHEDPEVRNRALSIFKHIKSPKFTERVVPLLGDEDEENRIIARQVLQTALSPEAEKLLFEAVKDQNKEKSMRELALQVLLTNPRPSLEKEIIEVLEKRDTDDFGVSSAAKLLIHSFPEGHEIFKEKLNDENPHVRIGAIITTASENDNRALRKIAEKLRDPNQEVRTTAANVLGEKGNAIVLSYLEEAMQDPNLGIWKACRDAINKIKERIEQ